jgi:hypothetical protein
LPGIQAEDTAVGIIQGDIVNKDEYIKRLRDALRETLDYAVNCWDNDMCNHRKHIPDGKTTFAYEFELLNEEIDQD